MTMYVHFYTTGQEGQVIISQNFKIVTGLVKVIRDIKVIRGKKTIYRFLKALFKVSLQL